MNTLRRSISTSTALLALVTLHLASDSNGTRAPVLRDISASVLESHGPPPRAPATDLAEEQVAESTRPVWRSDEVIVSTMGGQSIASIAADHGLTLRRAPGPSGYVPLRLAPGQEVAEILDALRADARVATADRSGFVYGTGAGSARASGDSGDRSYEDYQWHLDAISARSLECGDCDPSAFTVAVLDTGVAYEDYTDELTGVSYAQASSLEEVSFVAPKDFVNGDDHPNDDHQHGTHITSLIASSGLVLGVAPGVQIMPVKVLDAANSGSEADLVDAIVYAVENGADIINMSLCFTEGYAPSAALRDALQQANDAGVLMVAAAGNDGAQAALYPAASPLVISVGASQLGDDGELTTTSYGNTSPTVDLLAPGGNLEDDLDGDGYVDGILAETINPDDPTDLGLWFYAGTSQSTALVSGSLVWLLAAGETDLGRMTRALAAGSDAHGGFPYYSGIGAGDLNVQGAVDVALDGGDAVDTEMSYHVALLPFIKRASSKKLQPSLRVSVVDDDGEAASDVHVVGSWWGSDGASSWKCKTDSTGVCTVTLSSRKATTDDALAWGASADAAYSKRAKNKGWLTTDRPNGVVFVNAAMLLAAEVMDAEGMLLDTPIGISWDEGSDSTLGNVAAGYTVVNGAVGSALRPEAVLMTPGLLEPIAEVSDITFDLSDYGLDESYCGDDCAGSYVLLSVAEGSGVVTDPFGLIPIRIVLIEGLGIVTDPFQIRSGALSFHTLGSGIVTDPFTFTGIPLLMNVGSLTGLSLDGFALGDLVDQGGWLDEDDYPGATVMMSSGAAGMSWDTPSLASGALGSERAP